MQRFLRPLLWCTPALFVAGALYAQSKGSLGPSKESSPGNTTSIGTNLTPGADNTYDIGSTSLQWKNLYLDGTGDLLFDGRVSVTANSDSSASFWNTSLNAGASIGIGTSTPNSYNVTGTPLSLSGTNFNIEAPAGGVARVLVSGATVATFNLVDRGAAANSRWWGMRSDGGVYDLLRVDDDGNANLRSVLYIEQDGDTCLGGGGVTCSAPRADFDLQGTAANTMGQALMGFKTATIAADDTTPDVSVGLTFTTSANSGATAITDLDLPTAGQVVRICGGSDTNSSTIADSGNFNLSAAFTASLDDCITLLVQADNDYIELARVNN